MEYHRTYPASRRASSPPLPPKVHLDEEPGQATPRRRVSVACARCRKRKIRCSGDPGDGSGCQNCRSAGADLRECRFARVGSAEVAFVEEHLADGTFIPAHPMSAIDRRVPWHFYHNMPQADCFPVGAVRGAHIAPLAVPSYLNNPIEHYGFHPGPSTTQDIAPVPYTLQDQQGQLAVATGPRPAPPVRSYLEAAQRSVARPGQPEPSTMLPRRPPTAFFEHTPPYNMSALSLYPVERHLPLPATIPHALLPPPTMHETGRVRGRLHGEGVTADAGAKYHPYALDWAETPDSAHSVGRRHVSSMTGARSREVVHRGSRDSALLACTADCDSPLPSIAAGYAHGPAAAGSLIPIIPQQGVSPVPSFTASVSEGGVTRSNSSTDIYTVTDSEIPSSRTSSELHALGERYNAALNGSQRIPSTGDAEVESASRRHRSGRVSIPTIASRHGSGTHPKAVTTSSF